MNKSWLIIWLIILALGVSLRFAFLTNRAPFDWDQNRDYQKVSAIVSGKLTMLGPVAKGDNGFYLGPLYYYLLVPGLVLSSGNPVTFPVTSIMLDLLCLASLIYVAHKRSSERVVLTGAAFLWAVSWFVIENSRISWNVALLPLWIVWMYYFGTRKTSDLKSTLLYGLLAGLAWHIHASLLPLSLLLPLFFHARPSSIAKSIATFILGYLVSLAPLLAFDLRHAFFNARLMTTFVQVQSQLTKPDILAVVIDVIGKVGRNTSGLFGGDLQLLPYLGLTVVLLSFAGLFSGRQNLRWLGLVSLFNIFFVIMLKDLRFPEYYLSGSYLPIIIIAFSSVFSLPKGKLILGISCVLFAILNLSKYQINATPYSLANKIELVQAVSQLNQPVDVRYELSPGREGGLVPLLKQNGVEVTESAATKIIFTDKMDGPVVVGSELATELARFGGLRVAVHKLQ